MSKTISFIVSLIVFMAESLPNIVFIMFDDLGFNDVSYNGGPYPTPILDFLSNSEAIKLNAHYSEQVCSASRSALYTGRYSWRSGINTVATPYSPNGYASRNKLFSQWLQKSGYQNHFAGKWHVGYKSDNVPIKRAFISGLYPYSWAFYKSRVSKKLFSNIEPYVPICRDCPIKKDRDRFWPKKSILFHDMVELRRENGKLQEIPAHIGDTTYVDTLYTDHVIQFISAQDGTSPFFSILNLFTPHWTLTKPPNKIKGRPITEYKQCDNTASLSRGKKLFCKAMIYAQLCINEIIQTLKDNNFYDNTLIVVVSDNGPAPGTKPSFGQTLPLRGDKMSAFEGGIRTPAFLMGGYIKNLLSTMGVTSCEYDELVHISDWYHIFMSVVGISKDEYAPDSDHKLLEIWNDIKCKCNPNCFHSDNDNAVSRTELMQIKICGNKATRDSPSVLYSSYYIKDEWKLVVRGVNPLIEKCMTNPKEINDFISPGGYEQSDGKITSIPNQAFYNNFYKKQFKMNSMRAEKLYKSKCLEDLTATKYINNKKYGPFQYHHKLLYHLSEDKIEACNVNNSNIKNELYDELVARSVSDYDAQTHIGLSIGAIYRSFLKYDCAHNVIFATPWNDRDDKICDPLIKDDCTNKVWKKLIDQKTKCCQKNPTSCIAKTSPFDFIALFMDGTILILFFCGIFLTLNIVCLVHCVIRARMEVKQQPKIRFLKT